MEDADGHGTTYILSLNCVYHIRIQEGVAETNLCRLCLFVVFEMKFCFKIYFTVCIRKDFEKKNYVTIYYCNLCYYVGLFLGYGNSIFFSEQNQG